jgi:HAD superfamily hydrolase (TIGR01509 family)
MLNWQAIDTVLLDMDGTLLDLHFDNVFWKEFVPLRYAELHGLAHEQAKQQLVPRFKAMEGRLEWYCLDYWSADLQLNIAALKHEMAELIAVHPHVIDFLEQLRHSGRQLLLVTNAHRDSLALKMEKTCLAPFFDAIVCSHDYGLAKEQDGFWGQLAADYRFDPLRTLLVDDSVPVLDSAQAFGIAHLVSVTKPDSRAALRTITAYPAIEDFQALMLGL